LLAIVTFTGSIRSPFSLSLLITLPTVDADISIPSLLNNTASLFLPQRGYRSLNSLTLSTT
ncbi:unnamed protein product, partial [marine sediment metagenome]